jgi:hypothetical protein
VWKIKFKDGDVVQNDFVFGGYCIVTGVDKKERRERDVDVYVGDSVKCDVCESTQCVIAVVRVKNEKID